MAQIYFESDYNLPETVPLTDYLKEHAPLSGRSLRKYFFKGLVYRNGKKAHSQTLIKPGDHITVYTLLEGNASLEPEPLPIEIVFEDQNLLVLNKPASLAVHPSGNIKSGTLANGVAYYFAQAGIKAKVRPVNRLDYGTSGLIIFAKSAQAQAGLSEGIKQGRISRIYYALVAGVVENDQGAIALNLGEEDGIRKVTPNGKSALTQYQTIKRFPKASLLEISLQTGRTHQIRIHLNAIGHPIYGDSQYGVKSPLIKRPALHAGKLVFRDFDLNLPELQAAWPEDFQKLLEALAGASDH